MADALASIDGDVYRTPSPAAVAKLIESHGMGAAAVRWHWMGTRTLCTMAQSARAVAGHVATARRSRSYDAAQAAVCVEAAFVLGSLSRGERAAGIGKVRGRGICSARGLTPPSISVEDRGEATRLAVGAKRGDATATAAWEARLAHEQAVRDVLWAALALVPSQPATGRYVLPPLDDALRVALAGLPAEAVRAVFPALDLAPETNPAQPEETPVTNTADHRRAPDDATIRSDHAGGGTIVEIATRYGLSPASLYGRWRRLGLSAAGRLAGYGAAKAARAAVGKDIEPEHVQELVPEPVATPPAADPIPTTAAGARLGLEDLALAGVLVRNQGLRPAQAVAIVRADVATCAAASDHAVAAWYDAFVECGLAETKVAKAAAEARYASACEAFGVTQ